MAQVLQKCLTAIAKMISNEKKYISWHCRIGRCLWGAFALCNTDNCVTLWHYCVTLITVWHCVTLLCDIVRQWSLVSWQHARLWPPSWHLRAILSLALLSLPLDCTCSFCQIQVYSDFPTDSLLIDVLTSPNIHLWVVGAQSPESVPGNSKQSASHGGRPGDCHVWKGRKENEKGWTYLECHQERKWDVNVPGGCYWASPASQLARRDVDPGKVTWPGEPANLKPYDQISNIFSDQLTFILMIRHYVPGNSCRCRGSTPRSCRQSHQWLAPQMPSGSPWFWNVDKFKFDQKTDQW